MSWISGLKARLHLLFARNAAESRMKEEMGFHLEMETNRLVRDGLSPEEARRRALVTFGGVTQHQETLRDGRGLAWLGGLSLDFKLGLRMLRKYPGLTLVGSLAMAFGFWVGAVTFEMVMLGANPTLPLPGGDRIVQIRNWDAVTNYAERRVLHDFIAWRQSLTTVTDMGAWQDVSRNLVLADGEARGVDLAEITASAFSIAPTPPLLGRVLRESDESPNAAPVVVLGYDVWQARFAGDAGVLGRTIQLGDVYATVVGVMPEGFGFPISHDVWMPLKTDLLTRAPREGPGITIFGRLAPGVTYQQAQAELTTVGRRTAAELPATHEHLMPRVTPFTTVFGEMRGSDPVIFASINLFAIMLIVLICSNVALLLFARAATREGELIVRSALGASRSRIVMQLFAEALVLGLVASVIGLATAQFALQKLGLAFLEANLGRLPFWYELSLSPSTILYAAGLTVLGAGIAGVLPALKVTRGHGARLKQATAGGGGLKFGGVWTVVIVTQIAFTVAFPAITFVVQGELRRIRSFEVGFAADEFLGVQVDLDAAPPTGGEADPAGAAGVRYRTSLEELRRRIAAEPGVIGVTYVDQLPRMYHDEDLVEVEGAPEPVGQGEKGAPVLRGDGAANAVNEVSLASIDPAYFDVLESPILAGRAFHSGDIAPEARVVIVDQGFVDRLLDGRNAIGQRVRFAPERRADGTLSDEARPWYQIVGVVKELGMMYPTHRRRAAGMYFPADPARSGPLHLMVHVKGDPMTLAPRVREVSTAVDPALRLSGFQRVNEVTDQIQWVLLLWLRITMVLTAIALLLSLAGIYAVLSFTVARRTREIGVRVALGASKLRVVAAIFRRPLIQVAIGVVAGGALIAAGAFALAVDGLSLSQLGVLLGYAAFMLAVCLLACIVPTHRALRVEPTEALRSE
jgi:putative ABC transport system permease protein